MQSNVRICQADYSDLNHISALMVLLDGYARDPMGGAEPLSDFARENFDAMVRLVDKQDRSWRE